MTCILDFKKLFEDVAQGGRRKALYVEARDMVERFLTEAKQASFIDGFSMIREDEKPVESSTLYYIAGPLSETRYAKRRPGERSKADYYMRVAIDEADALVLTFTSSAYAGVAKKMGWTRGVCMGLFASSADLQGPAAKRFFTDIATFLYNAGTVIVQKNKRLAREQGVRMEPHALPR